MHDITGKQLDTIDKYCNSKLKKNFKTTEKRLIQFWS